MDQLNQATKQPSLTNHINDFEPVLSRAHECAMRLKKLSARLHGPAPEKAREAAHAVPSDSLLRLISDTRDHLVVIVDSIEASVGELETGF